MDTHYASSYPHSCVQSNKEKLTVLSTRLVRPSKMKRTIWASESSQLRNHTDINAGLVIILDSDHESPLDLADADKVADQFPPGWPCCRSVAFGSSPIGSSSCWARIVTLQERRFPVCSLLE